MIGRVVWVDYEETDLYGVLVRLGVRMEDGSKKNIRVEGTEPYIFAPKDEEVPEEDYIVRTEGGYGSLFGHRLQKIITETPKQAGNLTDSFSWTGEADVPYYRRVAIHDGLSGYVDIPKDSEGIVHIDEIDTEPDYEGVIEPRTSIADIEVRVPDDLSFDEMTEKGDEPINLITSYDTYEDKYSVFFYKRYKEPEGESIREGIESQLSNTDIEEYTDCDIELIMADDEVDMFNSYIEYCKEASFDLESGWNFIDFDREYIINRMRTLKDEGEDIHPAWLSPFSVLRNAKNKRMGLVGFPCFDMMNNFCEKLTSSNWRSKSLEYVANEELGIGKIDDVDINEDWKHNPSKLIAYNIVDVILTVALDDANDIHNFFYEIGDIASIPIYDTYYELRIVDGCVMGMRTDDEILPTADESELVENAGGYVAEAINGVKEYIGVVDLKSLYPSAIITWNLSTETVSEDPSDFEKYVKIPKVPEPKKVEGKIKEGDIDWGWLYASLDREGLIPKTTKTLFKKRNYEKEMRSKADEGSLEWKKWDRKQASTKVIMNSIYGNLSSKYYRLSNEYLGDAVTSTARYTLWKGEQSIKELPNGHIYSDTDSHFMTLGGSDVQSRVDELLEIASKLDEDASEIAQDIGIEGEHPFLDGSLHGDEYTCMVWEAEKIWKRYFAPGKKKRYAGLIEWKEGKFYDEPKISISGFENQRSDSMEVTEELQSDIIEMILSDQTFEDVSSYIRSVINEIDEENEDVKKFALPGSINKALEDYPNREIPRASMWSNEHLQREFGEGDDPFVYYVEKTPSELPETDVVALEWDETIPEGFTLNKEAIIRRAIRKPIESIINEAGWNFNELRSGKKQQTMDLSGGNPFS